MNYKNNDYTYDSWEQKRINESFNFDYEEVANEYDAYLRRYPKDFLGYTFYINALITMGRIDEAKKELDSVVALASSDKRILNKVNYAKCFNEFINYCKIRILVHEERWIELYRLINDPDQEFGNISLAQVKMYCRNKLGLLEGENKKKMPYLYRQMIKYDYNDLIRNMSKHLIDEVDYIYEQENVSVFSTGYPLDMVIEEVQARIPSDKGLFMGTINDTYIFKYDGCGRVNGKLVDYFKVVVFHGTNDIITMYPYANNKKDAIYTDLNYINDIIYGPNSIIRRKGQIDRFNAKYKRGVR